MSLSAAFNIISSSFAANSAQTAVVSNNIANVNTPGYSRQIANLVVYVCSKQASATNGAALRALEEFDASLQGLSPSTKRLYLAGAKALLRAAFPGPSVPSGVASYAEQGSGAKRDQVRRQRPR